MGSSDATTISKQQEYTTMCFLCNMTFQMAQEAKDQASPKSKDSKTNSSNPVSPTFLARFSRFGGMILDNRELSASGTDIIDIMGVCDEPPLAE